VTPTTMSLARLFERSILNGGDSHERNGDGLVL